MAESKKHAESAGLTDQHFFNMFNGMYNQFKRLADVAEKKEAREQAEFDRKRALESALSPPL